ncbi:hypothetical protein CYMTET_28750 [Cymbomonas tetramitiformis]|uniref:Uncharacterized protein n=1 Tax=Cymbomonas tetramitiformis TaxID=36881 RepID=A0AAE0FM71_9CHLO|nr:hypothetical protein CYMTET_28750 [Cymbomonas tetramitiformis]
MGAGLGAKAPRVKTSESALHAAAQNGEHEQLGKHIDNKKVNSLDEAGYTALHYAAAGGHVQEVIDLLRQRAIDPNIENKNDTTALLLAAGNGHEKVITELLADARVNPNKLNREGVSALHLAAQRGRVTAVTCLLQCSRVNPNLTGNVQRNSALHLAAYHGKLKSVQALCANSRVVLNFKNAKGRTPEDLALEHGHKQVATALQNEAKAREVTSNQKIKEQAEVMAKRRKEEAEAAAKEAAENPPKPETKPEAPKKKPSPQSKPEDRKPRAAPQGYGSQGGRGGYSGYGGFGARGARGGSMGGRGSSRASVGGQKMANQILQKQKEREASWASNEKAWNSFEQHTPEVIRYEEIPWPIDPNEMLRKLVAIGTADDPAKSNFDEVAKKTYRKLTLRWHPDKWDAKYGKRIKEEDRERILQQVKTVSQALNRAWDSGMY